MALYSLFAAFSTGYPFFPLFFITLCVTRRCTVATQGVHTSVHASVHRYNVFFTPIYTIVAGFSDQDVTREEAARSPQLYAQASQD